MIQENMKSLSAEITSRGLGSIHILLKNIGLTGTLFKLAEALSSLMLELPGGVGI